MEISLISVIMPAFNSEKTIRKAVESVLAQTYTTLELLIVVDPCKDKTVEIANSITDERIHLIVNEKRLGIANSRNLGVQNAKGEWIAFLDSDDAWAVDKLEKQMQAANESDLIFTGSAFVDENDDSIDYTLHIPSRVTYKDLLKQNIISCSSVLVRTKWISKNPMPNSKDITEDYASWLLILREVPYAIGIDEPLLIYRMALGSDSSNKIKMIKKNWNTYKYLKIPFFQAIISLCCYIIRSLKKYSRLKGAHR